LFDLSGKIAIITGGSRGLGLQIAEVLGEYGATTLLLARNQAELDEAVAHLGALGVKAQGYPADLSKPQTIAQVFEEIVKSHGRIDILVNNAGTSWGSPAEAQTPEQWTKVMDLNLTAVFFCSKEAMNLAMIPQQSGIILNMASVEGLLGHHPTQAGMIGYSTAKGGVINMTRALAAEWAKYGVRVNALAPGYFPSKLTTKVIEQHEQFFLHNTPLGKLGGPEDLKGPALLLCSAAGGHITGQILVIDGGATII
jgi:gluconate 5-dehydrogenase